MCTDSEFAAKIKKIIGKFLRLLYILQYQNKNKIRAGSDGSGPIGPGQVGLGHQMGPGQIRPDQFGLVQIWSGQKGWFRYWAG